MTYFEIFDKEDGTILASTLSKCPGLHHFAENPGENMQNGGFKNAVREYPHCTVRIIATEDPELMNGSRGITRVANIYADLVSVLKGMKRDQQAGYKVFSHNLITAHAKLQGEVESILPEAGFRESRTYEEQLNVAERAVNTNPNIASEALLQILKRVVDIQAQIEGFKILTGEVKPKFGSHNIKRTLLSVLYPFYEELNKKGIFVRLDIDDAVASANEVTLDYKLFNVAMHHFLNNTQKYGLPGSKVDITFNPLENYLEISMKSVRIDKEEIKEIFKMGIYGNHAAGFAGDGIGMYMVGRALEIMGANMDISSEYGQQEVVAGVPYTPNKFRIYFLKR